MKPYYTNDLVTIYNADCMDVIPVLRPIDIAVTSPPYNTGDKKAYLGESKYLHSDRLSDAEWEGLVYGCIELLLGCCRWSFFNIQMVSRNKLSLWRLFGKYGSDIKELIVWDKTHGEPAALPGVLNSRYELVFVFGDAEFRQFRGVEWHGTVDNVLTGPKAANRRWAKSHRATYPLYFPQWFIENFTSRGDAVLDPFFGIGTTAIASMKTGRRCVGIEKEEQYCEIAAKRCEQYRTGLTPAEQDEGQGTLFGE